MNATISGGPAFAHVHVDLESGEQVTAESGAMQSMSADLWISRHISTEAYSRPWARNCSEEKVF
jgi:uncharacterized protein (AIM24 family)